MSGTIIPTSTEQIQTLGASPEDKEARPDEHISECVERIWKTVSARRFDVVDVLDSNERRLGIVRDIVHDACDLGLIEHQLTSLRANAGEWGVLGGTLATVLEEHLHNKMQNYMAKYIAADSLDADWFTNEVALDVLRAMDDYNVYYKYGSHGRIYAAVESKLIDFAASHRLDFKSRAFRTNVKRATPPEPKSKNDAES